MEQDRRAQVFTRRVAIIGGAQLAAFGALIARLYQLQVVEGQRYAAQAEENRVAMRLLMPQRGRILDRYGTPLAVNRQSFRAILTAEQTSNVAATLDAIGELVTLTDTERRRVVREVGRRRRFIPVTIKDDLTWDEMTRIALNAPELPGVAIEVGASRDYPFGADLAHVLGYVAPVAEGDLTGDPLLEVPDIRIGRNGVERVYDVALRGRAGQVQLEINAGGRPVRELSRNDGDPGIDVILTLDAELQRFTAQALAREESATAVLMDVANGDVLALASHPSFEPVWFQNGIAQDQWTQLTTDPRAPLTNKAVQGQYAPGSTFKMMTAIAALEAGVVTPEQRVSCPGHLELGDNRFHCWKRTGHGAVDLVGALTESCDVYFYEVARRVGIDKIAEVSRRFGLGQLLALDLPGERAGLIPDRGWKQRTRNQPWVQGETLVNAIGQGYVLATPLQLAVMTARLVNGGIAVEPHLTRDTITDRRAVQRDPEAFARMQVTARHLSLCIRGMTQVVNDEHGTAYRMRHPDREYAYGGKTGTAQWRRITEEERARGLRRQEDLQWNQRDHALFVGFAPVDRPRYACSVVIEHGGGGSSAAAPIARDILAEAVRRQRQTTPARVAEGR